MTIHFLHVATINRIPRRAIARTGNCPLEKMIIRLKCVMCERNTLIFDIQLNPRVHEVVRGPITIPVVVSNLLAFAVRSG